MDKKWIVDLVKRVTISELEIKESMFSRTSTFRDLGADSIDEVELIMAFEEETGAEFPDNELEEICTPKKAEAYLCKKLLNK